MKMWWFMQSQSFSHCVSLFWQEMNEIFMVLYYRKNMYVENVVLFLTSLTVKHASFKGKKTSSASLRSCQTQQNHSQHVNCALKWRFRSLVWLLWVWVWIRCSDTQSWCLSFTGKYSSLYSIKILIINLKGHKSDKMQIENAYIMPASERPTKVAHNCLAHSKW